MKKYILIPRTLAIIYILFISLFALDADFGLGLLMHLLPTFFLIGALVLAWNKPFVGGIVFVILGIIFTIFFNTYESAAFFIISLPLLVIGGLFTYERYR